MKNLTPHLLLASLFAVFLSSCASVPMGEVKDDKEAKTFQVPPQVSRIYLYRNESLGSAVKIPVTLDGQSKGQTAKDVYFYWDVAPGIHTIACMAEANSKLVVTTAAGKATYVWQEMKMGLWSAGCKLSEVDAVTGKQGVNDCKLAVSIPSTEVAPKTTNAEKLRQLKALKDDGTITETEYQVQKKKLLDQGL